MEVIAMAIPDVKLIRPVRHGDARGYFSEVYNRRTFSAAGLDLDFIQDNQSLSAPVGTLRGLHFQSPPVAQTKLIRVLKGAIFDVAVDLRRGSPWYGKHVTIELRAGTADQFLVPKGFAHGFVTIEPDTEAFYKVDAYYSAAHDHGLLWNDPDLGITWPARLGEITLSSKDRAQPRWRDFVSPFLYENQGKEQAA